MSPLKLAPAPADNKDMSSTPTPMQDGPRYYSVTRSRSGGLEIRWTESTEMAAGCHTVDGPGAEYDAGRALLHAHGYSEVA